MGYELQVLEEGLVQATVLGDTDDKDIEAFRRELAPSLEASTPANPLRILVDTWRAAKSSSAVRQAYAEITADPRVGRVAVVGANRYNRVLGNFVLKATGRRNIRFFRSKEEALAWLRGNN